MDTNIPAPRQSGATRTYATWTVHVKYSEEQHSYAKSRAPNTADQWVYFQTSRGSKHRFSLGGLDITMPISTCYAMDNFLIVVSAQCVMRPRRAHEIRSLSTPTTRQVLEGSFGIPVRTLDLRAVDTLPLWMGFFLVHALLYLCLIPFATLRPLSMTGLVLPTHFILIGPLVHSRVRSLQITLVRHLQPISSVRGLRPVLQCHFSWSSQS